MRKLLLLCAVVCALGMVTACKGGAAGEARADTVPLAGVVPLADTTPKQEAVADTPFVERTLVVEQEGLVWEDITISKATFDSASSERDKYQLKRIERTPNATDSAIVRKWAKSVGYDFSESIEECGFYRFEGAEDIVELSMGDYCVTRTLIDTTLIPTCWMCLSTNNLLGGWWSDAMYYDPDEDGAQGLVYICPFDYAYRTLGKPYVYRTHPRWYPAGDQFWGEEGWFFIQGCDAGMNDEYHKVRPRLNQTPFHL